MRILLLSDSHSRSLLGLNLNGYDYIIHCGDINETDYYYLRAFTGLIVSGNCDYTDENDKIITIKNKKIFITHGHKYYVKQSYDYLISKAKEIGADIVMFGHTHCRCFHKENGILLINPGSYMDGSYVEMTDKSVCFMEENTSNEKDIIFDKYNIGSF